MITDFVIKLLPLVLLFAVAAAAVAIWWFRKPAAHAPLEGIRGWLILVAISHVVSPIVIAAGLVRALPDFRTAWQIMPAAVVGEVALNLLLLGFVAYCAVLLFNRRRLFPRLFIWQLWLSAAFPLVDAGWFAVVTGNPFDEALRGEDVAQTFFRLIAAILWTTYMLMSRRVRNTFVR